MKVLRNKFISELQIGSLIWDLYLSACTQKALPLFQGKRVFKHSECRSKFPFLSVCMSRTWLGKRLQRNKRIFEVSVMTKYDPILLLLFLSRVVKLHFYVKRLSPFGSSPFLKCIWRITRCTAVASFHGWVLIRTKLLMSGKVYSISLETVGWSLSESKCFALPPSAALLFQLALGTSLNCCIPTRFCFTCELCKCQPLCTQSSSVVLPATSVDSLCHSHLAFFFNVLQLMCLLLDERVNFSLISVFHDSTSFLKNTLFGMTLDLL